MLSSPCFLRFGDDEVVCGSSVFFVRTYCTVHGIRCVKGVCYFVILVLFQFLSFGFDQLIGLCEYNVDVEDK